MEYGFLSLLPSIITIGMALKFKNVFLALFSGIFTGSLILSDGNIIEGLNKTLYSYMNIFQDVDNTIIITVTLLIGGIIYAIEKSGGIEGFLIFLLKKKSLIKSKRAAEIFTWIIGVMIFTSGTLSTLVTGSITRPINDALKVPHEKSSFIVHTTSTPICVLLPFSGWGASMIGYIQASGLESELAAQVMWKSIFYNFYAIIAVVAAFLIAFFQKDFGHMKTAELRTKNTGALNNGDNGLDFEELTVDNSNSKAFNLVFPILVLVVTIVSVLLITGEGDISKGKGMMAILWGGSLSAIFMSAALWYQKIFTPVQFTDIFFKGASEMLPIGIILVSSFAIGGVVKELGTGIYLAESLKHVLSPGLLPVLGFVMACLISFATGTSLGTMSITMILVLPMAISFGVNLPLVASAVIGGSIFGDHSSPISDTTVMTCSSTGCPVIDHIRTQLPYTLTFASMAIVCYIVAGFVI
ncbi:MAG: Na+/H+ antiporter NhaC family protein [Cetobacterium sp.]